MTRALIGFIALLSGAMWGASQIVPHDMQTVAIVSSGSSFTGAPMDERERFAVDLLAQLGNTQPTQETVAFIVAWQVAENTTAAFNPLATTQNAPGATCFNSVCVKNYPDYETGLLATVETITNGFYPRTYEGLVINAPVADDEELGTWGTGAGNVRAQWGR